MRIIIIGFKGMLGHALEALLVNKHELINLDLPEINIIDLASVKSAIASNNADLIINSAAYTDVDGCESNVDHAYAVNSLGPRNLAVVCNALNIPLVHISTDYIFDGTSGVPYKEWDAPNPQSIYGRSKLQGERYVRELCSKHYIVRTSWLYGQNGKNFVATMLRLAKEKNEIGVVNDQIGSPTYTVDLAKAITELITEPAYGTYHITNSGVCSWYEFTIEIFKQAGIDNVKVKPITTKDYNRPAKRPAYSVMDNYVWRLQGKQPLRNYKEALADYLKSINEGDKS